MALSTRSGSLPAPGIQDQCPNCGLGVQFLPVTEVGARSATMTNVGFTTDAGMTTASVTFSECPLCHEPIVSISFRRTRGSTTSGAAILWPRTPRPDVKVSPHVPDTYRDEFVEASLVLPISPKASAALARRLLQRLLREVANVKGKDLAAEIDAVLPSLPAEFAEDVDLVRNFGNIAAHPIHELATGTLLDVVDHEAETCLLVIEHLFDFYFERPAAAKVRRDAHVAKLATAGKTPKKP